MTPPARRHAGPLVGRPRLGAALIVSTICIAGASPLRAQVGREPCTLTWEPTSAATRSLSVRESADAHITHVSGGMVWTCGTATMEADSAVKFDLARRVELIGNVFYRDTIRTLSSRFLTYYEIPDRVIATDSVRLVRIGDGSRLTGPRVEFLRAVSGIDQLTTATGRPHMTFYPEGDEPGDPFEVDADVAIFAGEEEARAYGAVEIERPDLRAAADSAHLQRADQSGILWGSPWVEAREIRLEGDTILFRSEEGGLREVHAIRNGHAASETFEVRSEIIDVAVADDLVDAVWAHGDGRAEAVSSDQHVSGDSLRFAMLAGKIDTLFAVGQAAAVRETGPGPARLRPPGSPPDTTGAAADSTAAPPDTTGAAADTTEAASDTTAAPPDTTGAAADTTAAPPDTTGAAADTTAAPPDTTEAAADTTAAPPDTAGRGGDSTAVSEDAVPVEPDSTAGEPPAEEGGDSAPRRVAGPRLPTGEDANWVVGDTLIAVFERPERAPADSAAGDSTAGAPDTGDPGAEPAAARSPTATETDSLPAAQADTAVNRLERLTVIGNARALYAQVRDSAAANRPSRSYMVGKRIDIFFREGEPDRVEGREAIGLYLEPMATPRGVAPGAARAAADSAAFPGSPSDTTGTGGEPPDTTGGGPPDTTGTGGRPPDTTQVRGAIAATPTTVALARTVRPPGRSTASGRDPAAPAARSRRWASFRRGAM